jgi:hypothetical protein
MSSDCHPGELQEDLWAGRRDADPCGVLSQNSQKMNLRANCMMRGSPLKLLICPKVLLEAFWSGSPRWVVLNRFSISHRSSRLRPSRWPPATVPPLPRSGYRSVSVLAFHSSCFRVQPNFALNRTCLGELSSLGGSPACRDGRRVPVALAPHTQWANGTLFHRRPVPTVSGLEQFGDYGREVKCRLRECFRPVKELRVDEARLTSADRRG